VALIAAGRLPRGRNLVRIGQWETSVRVIKRRICPHNRVVTLRAERSREARSDVVRHGAAKRRRAAPCRLVAPITIRIGRSECVVVVGVAVGASIHFARGRELVRTEQRPTGRGVVKHHVRPQRRIVAVRTVGSCERCARCGVGWIIGLLPGRQVALRIAAVGRLNRKR
jgi:hypothetical protein